MINNIQGAYQAVSYLIRKYRKQPGYLRSSYPINNFQERADGFYKAVRASGMSASKSLVHRLTPSMDGAYSDMLSLLDAGEEPARCYFADNDLIACGALKAFRKEDTAFRRTSLSPVLTICPSLPTSSPASLP